MPSAARQVAMAAALLASIALAAPTHAAPAMWSASDADSKVYLFGSVHVLPPGTEWRTPAFEAILKAAPEVYFETDIGPWGQIALTMKMVGAAISAAQSHWIDHLTPDQTDKLKAALTRNGLSLDSAKAMPPWALQVQLQIDEMNPGKEKLDPMQGVDAALEWEVPKERKAFFETPGQQYDLLASDPLDVQVKNLLDSIDTTDSAAPSLDTLVTAWAKGDVDAIAATNVPKSAEDAAETQRVLLDRNKNWLPTIERLLRDNREDLIVVGAAHLAGPGSVLDLLAQAGYTVTRIQ